MKVGLIGTGLMGLPLAQRLLEADEISDGTPDITLTVYNRTAAKLAPLQQAGANIADSPAALLQASQCVITMLTNAEAVQQTLLTEAARSHLAGRTVIQMGTIAPSESRSLQAEMQTWGATYLEAPVLGSIPEARVGKLLVMVGGEIAQFEQWLPLLSHFGVEPLLVGEVGSAAALKLALNQLIGSLTTAFALSLGFLQRQGVAIDTFMQVLRQSALYAPTFDKKLQRMVEGNYESPNFPVKHLLKDVNLFQTEATDLGQQLDSLVGVQHILEQAIALGLAEADYSALFAAVNPSSSLSESGDR